FLFFRWLSNGGPPLATSLAAFFDTFALLIVFRMRYGPLGLQSVGRSCLNFLFASLVMGILTYFFIHIPGVYEGELPRRTLALIASIALATGAYFGIARLLRFKELQEMGGIFAHGSPSEDA